MKTTRQVIIMSNRCHSKLIHAALILLAGLFILPAAAQNVLEDDHYIFISGHLSNDVNGAPISDHDIYILSDSTSSNGFEHFSIVKTDVNGFYRDTIITQEPDGAMIIYLYDFEDNIVIDTFYYRFTFSNEYQMIGNFEIHNPHAIQTLQANFEAKEDTLSGNELSVIFRDKTYGYEIKNWVWDFGDGYISSIQDPNHTYAEPGIYMVSLTVCSYPHAFEYFQTSTIVKQVEVAREQYYHLGGHVFTGLYPPIDKGLAYLYMVSENDEFIPIDTTFIDTLGYYYFYQLLEGKYTIKVRLDEESVSYGQYMPTYLGNTLSWEQAEHITLDATNWECDINLIRSEGIPFGKGVIVGKMLYDTLISHPLVPAHDIEVVLLGAEGSHITTKMSDLQGDFEFSELAYGTYQLLPDVAGVPVLPVFITISEEDPVAEDFSLVISPFDVTYLGIGDPEESTTLLNNLYPNPATEWINLEMEMEKAADVEVMILGPMGRCLSTQSYALDKGEQKLIINLSMLSSGYYQVLIKSEEKTGLAGKIIVAK